MGSPTYHLSLRLSLKSDWHTQDRSTPVTSTYPLLLVGLRGNVFVSFCTLLYSSHLHFFLSLGERVLVDGVGRELGHPVGAGTEEAERDTFRRMVRFRGVLLSFELNLFIAICH